MTPKKTPAARRDVCQDVTDAIVNALEAGTKPWMKPWEDGEPVGRPLRHNGVPYRGINVVILWSRAAQAGFTSPFWMTYLQAQEMGSQVRKGERATTITYYGSGEVDEEGEEEEGDDNSRRVVRFLRTFNVFNANQIDGLPAHFYAKADMKPVADRIYQVEAFAKATGADIREGGNRAFYTPGSDYVQMPPFASFRDAELFYSTELHELTHWTSHTKRLARDFGRQKWGDEGYAMEELVAELGAAFLGAEFGFRPEHIDDHAAYIASWLKVLRNDKRAVFKAAAAAQIAADYLLAFSRLQEERSAA